MALTLGGAILVLWIGMHVAPRFTVAVAFGYTRWSLGVVV